MFKLVLFFTFSLSFAMTLEDCKEMALQYGVDLGAERISKGCHYIIRKNANFHQVDHSPNKFRQYYGVANMIYIKIFDQKASLKVSGIVAGLYTGLKEIIAIDYDEVGDLVYALNEDEQGERFIVAVQGNQAGARATRVKLYSSELSGATNLRADRKNGHLYVTGPQWVKVFNIDAHHKSARPEQSIEVLKSLEGNNTNLGHPKDLVIIKNKIYVLDFGRILVFDRNITQTDSAPIEVIPPNQKSGLAMGLENVGGEIKIIYKRK